VTFGTYEKPLRRGVHSAQFRFGLPNFIDRLPTLVEPR